MAEADFGKLPDKWNGGIVEEVAKKDKYGRVPQAALKKYGWFNYNFNMITYRGKLNVSVDNVITYVIILNVSVDNSITYCGKLNVSVDNTITYGGKLNVFYMAMGFWGSVYYLARRKIKKNKAKNAAAAAAH
ncbi:hypothetical protein FSP39_011683 [Pinctada imbricata]|uniref:Uncharacterized protein n=1 Tax=Pinctada imbricata TaxID=66713 RepID=A0AA88XZ25_PINIB|nr:hypothetical protein FSP39_011683 [Pinctada imbricata]